MLFATICLIQVRRAANCAIRRKAAALRYRFPQPLSNLLSRQSLRVADALLTVVLACNL